MRPSWLLTMPLLLACAPAAAQDSVSGTLTVDGRVVPMTHVYARETRGSETSEDDPAKVIVLITDRPAPPEVIRSRQAYYDAGRDGTIRGVIVTFEQASAKPRLAVFVPGANDDTTIPDIFERIALNDLQRGGGTVAGHLKTSEPMEFVPDGAGPDTPQSYAMDVRFRVSVTPAPQPSQVLTGPAARTSEPAAAAERMLDMVHKGAIEEMKPLLLPGHPMLEAVTAGEGHEALKVARDFMPRPAAFRAGVQRVVFYGDEAAVVGKDKDGTTSVWLRRVDGAWKVAPAPIPHD